MLSYLTTCFCSLRAAWRQIAMLPAAAGARIGINTYRTMQTLSGHWRRNAMPAGKRSAAAHSVRAPPFDHLAIG